MADGPALVTIPNVEIVSTGTYELSFGTTTFTADDLASAVAAQDDPGVRAPRLKLGHTSLFGDAEPAFGKVDAMRLSEDGQTIVGDLIGVPAWLAEIFPTAYPARSIEGYMGAESATGKRHAMVITALSLLGVVMPGVTTLEDLEAMYGEKMPEGTEVAAGLFIEAKTGDRMAPTVAAAVEVEDVRRSYYDTLNSDQAWWWIRAIRLDPQDLIVDDDERQLYRVPWTVQGDAVSFGDPVPLRIEYVDEPQDEKTEASRPLAVFASRAESRPASTTTMEVTAMDEAELRRLLGLAEDASDEQVRDKLNDRVEIPPDSNKLNDRVEIPPDSNPDVEVRPDEDQVQEAPDQTAEDGDQNTPQGPQVPDGMVLIDSDALSELRDGAREGVAARRQQVAEERATYLTAAVKAGKFPPFRLEHYARLLAADSDGTRHLIDSLASGLVPVDERGSAPAEDGVDASGYDSGWLSPAERQRIAAAHNPVVTQEV